MEARLLRADPAVLPSDAALMDFARPPGADLFEAHCAKCHGLTGRGDSARGIPDLTDGDWLYGNGEVADIERVIDSGIRSYRPKSWNLASMPAYARPRPSRKDLRIEPLTPGDIRDVVEFLIQAQGRDADPAAALRGAAIYGGRGMLRLPRAGREGRFGDRRAELDGWHHALRRRQPRGARDVGVLRPPRGMPLVVGARRSGRRS